METEKTEKDAEQDNPSDKAEEARSDKNLYIMIGLLLLTIAAIIFIPRLFDKTEPPKTVDELIHDTITEGETEDRRLYNGFVFIKQDNIWFSEVQVDDTLYKFGTRFNPYQVENVTVVGNVDERFRKGEIIYITFQPNDEELTYISLAAAELSLNLARAMGLEVRAACMQEHEGCVGREIITCNSTDSPVISLIRDDEAKLVMDGNCMEIRGDGFELLRVADRVIFQAYGIMG